MPWKKGKCYAFQTIFFRNPNVSPGGYATAYHSYAETFLEIGDACGKAKLELAKGQASE